MTGLDEAKRLRIREARRETTRGSGRNPAPPAGPRRLVARTKVVRTYPSVASAYYACETQTVIGAEVEGGTATVSGDGDDLLRAEPRHARAAAGDAVRGDVRRQSLGLPP